MTPSKTQLNPHEHLGELLRWIPSNGRRGRTRVGPGSGGGSWTHYGDSARGGDGADGARALSKGVPEHLVEVSDVTGVGGKQLQAGCNCVEGRLRQELMKFGGPNMRKIVEEGFVGPWLKGKKRSSKTR